MERQRSHSKSKGLVSKLIAPALIGAAGLMGAGKAQGDYIQVNGNFPSGQGNYVRLYHLDGGGLVTDGYDDGIDTPYSARAPPVVDFYSIISDTQHPKLAEDNRDNSSTSTYHTLMQGNTLTYPASGNLSFNMDLFNGDFGSLPILADVYKNNELVVGNINVRDYAANNTQVPLSLGSNSDVYNIDVRFVPEGGTLGMLGAGALAAGSFGLYNLLTRRKEE
jgi:hypothetical protein